MHGGLFITLGLQKFLHLMGPRKLWATPPNAHCCLNGQSFSCDIASWDPLGAGISANPGYYASQHFSNWVLGIFAVTARAHCQRQVAILKLCIIWWFLRWNSEWSSCWEVWKSPPSVYALDFQWYTKFLYQLGKPLSSQHRNFVNQCWSSQYNREGYFWLSPQTALKIPV